jgi:ABC-type sulfate transport system permease component
MTARLDSFQRTLAAFGAVLFTAAFVVFSTPVLPLA